MYGDTNADASRTVSVIDLMDVPDTGGLDDEIGGHVALPDGDHPEVTCPRCGDDIWTDSIGHGCVDGFRRHPKGEPGETA